MGWIRTNEAVQQLGDNIFLYDLSSMRGTQALLNRIPNNLGGVYAWYRHFDIDPASKSDPEIFVSAILNELYKPHCATREAHLPPSTKLIVEPETVFPKHHALKKLAADSSFRELLLMLLNNSLLFQQPLYIGKANNLLHRIRSHLYEGSTLRERLKIAEHDLDKCKLLLVVTSESQFLSDVDNFETEEEAENEFSELEPERLIEDILSRLFLPSFTIKYG